MVMQCSDELPPYRSLSCSFSTGKTIFAEPLKEEEENMDANNRSPRMCQTYPTAYHIIWLITLYINRPSNISWNHPSKQRGSITQHFRYTAITSIYTFLSTYISKSIHLSTHWCQNLNFIISDLSSLSKRSAKLYCWNTEDLLNFLITKSDVCTLCWSEIYRVWNISTTTVPAN